MSHETSPPPPPTRPSAPATAAAPAPVVSATLSLDGFVDNWPHCQHIADYLARFAASDRFDPEQLTTRLSTYLNEVLELVYRSRAGAPAVAPGELVITIIRGDRLHARVDLPADGGERLRRSVRRATGPDAPALYRQALAGLLAEGAADDDDDDGAGLLELVALHGIAFALHDAGARLVLTMSVPHE